MPLAWRLCSKTATWMIEKQSIFWNITILNDDQEVIEYASGVNEKNATMDKVLVQVIKTRCSLIRGYADNGTTDIIIRADENPRVRDNPA